MSITITSGSIQNYPSGAYFTGELYGVPEESRSLYQIYQASATGSTSNQTFAYGFQYQFTIDSNYADGQHFEFETSPISNNLVTFKLRYLDADDPNQQPSYTFRFTAEDRDGETATQEVTVYLKDLDDTAPTITSSNSLSIVENSGAQQVVYTVTSDDTNDVLPWLTTPESYQEPNRPFTKYAFGETGQDNSYFTIDTETGEVTLTDTPDYEEKSEYTFSVVAYDSGDWRWLSRGENYSDEFFVTLTVVNIDEAGPVITSGATADAIDENSGQYQIVYTVTADDSADSSSDNPDLVFSLGVGADNSDFVIRSTTGEVRLVANPNYEVKNQYSFSVFATDEADNSSIEQFVTLNINLIEAADSDGDESALGANPNYAVLLPQIPLLTGQAKLDKIDETFIFNFPLTPAESQLFEYGSYAYMLYTPGDAYLVTNPNSDDTSYVGNYEGFPPVFSTGEALPPPETPPVDPVDEPDIPLPPGPVIPESEVIIVSPVTEEPNLTPDLEVLENNVPLVDLNGRLLVDSNGNAITLASMTHSARTINIKLANLE